jgi:hypothetical protein
MHWTELETVSADFGISASAVEEITVGSSFASMSRRNENAIDWKDVETDLVQSVAGVKPKHRKVFETDSACYEIVGSDDGEKPGSEVVMMHQWWPEIDPPDDFALHPLIHSKRADSDLVTQTKQNENPSSANSSYVETAVEK